MKTTEIEQDFELESLKRFLEKNPEQSMEIALDFFDERGDGETFLIRCFAANSFL